MDASSAQESHRFGTGWISGTLAVVLSVVGILGVLCFHFPEYLTIPDARDKYPIPVMRALLHVILVAGFLLGLTSVMLRHNKALGLVAMAVVLIAALLGGSRVPLEINPDAPDVYLGLDYVLLLLIGYSIIFIPLEKLFYHREQEVFRFGWKIDLTYFFITSLLVQLTTYLTLQPAMGLFGWAVFPSVQNLVRSQPGWLQFLEIMLIVDFVQYWMHRMFHEIPWLWRFHAVHHSGTVMDWMAGNRNHIVDIGLTRSLIYIPSFILGFDHGPMIAYIVVVAVYSVFIHANLRWRFGALRYVFATPQFHHWHHGVEPEAINKNYAVHFPFYDLLFGTFHLPGERWPAAYGVKNNDVPESYLLQWIYPFQRKQKPVPAADET
jgi:lathosterol oxidase